MSDYSGSNEDNPFVLSDDAAVNDLHDFLEEEEQQEEQQQELHHQKKRHKKKKKKNRKERQKRKRQSWRDEFGVTDIERNRASSSTTGQTGQNLQQRINSLGERCKQKDRTLVILLGLFVVVLLTKKIMGGEEYYDNKDPPYDPRVNRQRPQKIRGANADHTSVTNHNAIRCGHDKKCSCEERYPQTLKNMMRQDEKDLMVKYIQGKRSYFEWGSGGSTDTFPRILQVKDVTLSVSVENYMPWCNKLKQLPYLQCKMSKQELRYFCIDPGVVLRTGGNLVHQEDVGSYTGYIDAIHGLWWRPTSSDGSLKNKKAIQFYQTFDVILVDGRARVACALNSLSAMSSNSVLIMHDWTRYGQRDSLLHVYFDVVETTVPVHGPENKNHNGISVKFPRIAVLKKKKGVMAADAEDMMEARLIPM